MKKIILTIAIATLGFFQIASAQTATTTLGTEIESTVRETLQGFPKLNVELENVDTVEVMNAVVDGLNGNLNTGLNQVLVAHHNDTEVLVNAVAHGLEANMTASIVNVVSQNAVTTENNEFMMVQNEIENTISKALQGWL